ncbi:MAG TPA: hypothetical protein VOA80_00650 [Thermoanaerobaculia bacterium]|nr:hypothetical protein [Thermoanaerobaculia bacterium]
MGDVPQVGIGGARPKAGKIAARTERRVGGGARVDARIASSRVAARNDRTGAPLRFSEANGRTSVPAFNSACRRAELNGVQSGTANTVGPPSKAN